MRCSRAGSKLLKFARAAIFRPDMINSGTVLPRTRGTRGARARAIIYFKKKDPRDRRFFFKIILAVNNKRAYF